MIRTSRSSAKSTRYQVVRADVTDLRGWMQDGPVCPLLAQHHISHCGIMKAVPPFEIVRANQSGTFMLACLEGRGGDSGRRPLETDPRGAGVPAAALRHERAQVSARETVEFRLGPLPGSAGDASDCIFDFAGDRHLRRGTAQGRDRGTTRGKRFGKRGLGAASLERAGASLRPAFRPTAHSRRPAVAGLAARGNRTSPAPWTLDELADIACLSGEHLRRLCRKELGRSPMQHLTHLRLQRARHLLSVTDDKVEVIARAVGFESAFTFSNTFNKWIGWRPSELRGKI